MPEAYPPVSRPPHSVDRQPAKLATKPLSNNDIQARLFRDLFDLSGQVALVTGGLGRLGREYVTTLARAGASVGVLDVAGTPDRSPS